jgi:uncharacterized tellurite resistance protein B-like protein
MGFRFFRRVKVLPGGTLNFSKSGVSTSFGPKGAKVTFGPRGVRKTVGIPGTGLFYTETSRAGKTNVKEKSSGPSCLLIVGILFGAVILISLIYQYKWFFLGLAVVGVISFIVYTIYKSSASRSQANLTNTIPVQEITEAPLTAKPSLYIPSRQDTQPQFQWYGKGTQIKVGTYLISDPMTYYSEDNPSYTSFGGVDESSCIYAPLPVGTPLDEGKNALGYWPHYSRMTPNQRANYLEWLAGGRKGILTDIGYAFTFFYGLERRSLIEQKDIGPILQEAMFLLARYQQSGSFNSYLCNYVNYIISRAGLDRISPEQFKLLFEKTPISSFEEGLAVGLAWLYKHSIPLPTSWAKKVAGFDPKTTKSVVADRFPANFNQLFSLKYKERFDKGLVLNALEKDRGIDYVPASPTLRTTLPLNGNNPLLPTVIIPNVIGLQHQFDPIVDIWNQSVEELKPLSRKVSRGLSAGSRESYEVLPDELKKLTDHPDRTKWNKIIEKNARGNGFSISKISYLAETQGIEKKFSLTMKESIGLAETAGYMKLAIEPDPRITKLPYKWDDTVALYYPAGARTVTNNPQYVSASLILELGISVAYADGFIDKKEASQISQFLDYLFTLDPIEAQRLEALKQVLIHQKPSLQNIKKRFQKSLSEADLEKISGFLISVANADGSISQNEIVVLKSIYKAFGIEADRIKSLISSLQSPPTEPIVVREAKKTESIIGEKIPEQPTQVREIVLDKAKLDKLIKDTNGISTVIRRTMLQNEAEISAGPRPSSAATISTPKTKKIALDRKYYRVLATILRSRKCERRTFERYARECGIMPNAAIEAINEWAYSRFGQNLIKDEDPITVNEPVYLRIKNELNHNPR